jgi:hypothetical protein
MAVLVALDHPAYHQRVRLRKYNARVTVFQASNDGDAAAKVLRRAFPLWTPEDHRRLAMQHATIAGEQQVIWGNLANEAALKTWGRPYSVFDYRISGIASDEFDEQMKSALRTAAHASTYHGLAAAAHARAARGRS